ncbi:MAG: glycosyltransferase family 2 protein [Candidatus Micrarchaeaceae archaeon]|jgi:cellulose synthase/poly-beta-1,6-N-acetylglucosamine synthase-like glycosyltransferase
MEYPKAIEKRNVSKRLEVSVIVPIYNEDTDMIKGALDTLLNQNGIRINLIAVIKGAKPGQIQMIKNYEKVLHKVEIIMQKGKASQNEAYLIGLGRVVTEYTCILASDAKIKDNNLVRMLTGLEKTGKNAAFGLLYPEIKDTKAGRFAAIAKIFRQTLTLKGRAILGLGSYIPGAFAVYRTKFLKAELKPLMKNDFVMHDLGLTMRLYANSNDKLYFIPEEVGTELERSTFSSWALQYARWFMGSFGLVSAESKVFSDAKNSIKIGTLGLIVIWNILPLSMSLGFLLSIVGLFFGLQFFLAYMVAYLILTLILLTLSDARNYGIHYCVLYWLLSPFIQSFGFVASIYGFALAKYHENKTYTLFKR